MIVGNKVVEALQSIFDYYFELVLAGEPALEWFRAAIDFTASAIGHDPGLIGEVFAKVFGLS